ncbi:TetR family transcriptional regulator [Pseudonocardia sp. NPDC049154]|uniref:TetR/AcrR family transcriptional regulator n=1 Tax=Pseudonocardia sp. NPDC049154 TaxID=3155501 RepID=UPI00340CC0D2
MRYGVEDAGGRSVQRVVADLFHQHGYDTVAVRDIAAAAGVAVPVVYRRYDGKQDVLRACVRAGLDLLAEVLREAALEEDRRLVERLGELSVECRSLWALLLRESRHLEPDERAATWRRADEVVTRLAAVIERRWPGIATEDAVLRAHVVRSTLEVPGRFPRRRARQALTFALAEVAAEVVHAPPGEAPPPAPEPTSSAATDRPAEIARIAAELFVRHGFGSVAVEDVASRAGLTGAGVYHYFPSKADLLTWIVRDGVDRVERSRTRVARDRRGPAAGLRDNAALRVALALREPWLCQVLTEEWLYLAPGPLRAFRLERRAWMDAWQTALRGARPDLDAVQVDVRLGAALSVVHDLARSADLRVQPNIRTRALAAVCGCFGVPDAHEP